MASSRIDALYALPTSEFVAARNALAKELKREGNDGEASAVARLRKPSAVAAAVNLAARADRDAVDALIEAGARLRHAQRGAGTVEALREAIAQQREALRALQAAAEAQLEDATPAQARSIQSTLQAASAGDEAVRDRLRRGVLEDALDAPGFDALGLGALAGLAPERPEGEAAHAKGAANAKEAERTKDAARAAKEEQRREAQERQAKAREAAQLSREAARLEAAAKKLRAKARDAEEEAERSRKEADEAEQRAAAARARADAAAKDG